MRRRVLAFVALVVATLVVFAAPASAHATLLSTDPAQGAVYARSPSAVSLRFSEAVEVSLGGIRVFTGSQQRVVTGSPQHPGGAGDTVRVSIPKLANGSYVVTWRVISADSHPVEGAFTFQVGATASVKNAQGLAVQLLATSGGSQAVGVVYAIDRGVLYASLALLIGGLVFVVFVWRRGRGDRRATRVIWLGWIGTAVATVAGIALEGVYGAALPLSKVFDPTVFGDVIDTRYGRIALVRLLLLVCALPLVWMVTGRGDPAERRLPPWWPVAAGLVGVGLALTPGLAGHAATGIQTGLAIPADALHVLAMACWLGGLVVLCVAVLPRKDPDELRSVLPRYSSLALGAVVVLICTGVYQAWRQVGSINALRNTDYGQLLLAKLVAFAALIVAAAVSREVVNRRFRGLPPEPEPDLEPVPVGVAAVATGPGRSGGADDAGSSDEPADDDLDDDDWTEWDEWNETTDEEQVRRLRRSVFVEVLVAIVVLGITAVLVNAAPARTTVTQPVALTLKSAKLWVYVEIAPGVTGKNDIHVTALPTGGGLTTVQQMEVQLTKPGADLPPFDVPLQQLGSDHSYAPLYDIPYPGTWQIIVRVQTSATDEVVLTGKFSLR